MMRACNFKLPKRNDLVIAPYVSNGRKKMGPMNRNPKRMKTAPSSVKNLGRSNLSHKRPQNGAVMAYVPPLMMNTSPVSTLVNPNYERSDH
jgi:hypothetical protein